MEFSEALKHSHLKNYIVYCLLYILEGALMIGLGPLIPYIAEYQNKHETQYSIFFLARALGFIIGAISVNFSQKWLNYHQALALGAFMGGIFSIFFGTTFNINICTLFIFFSAFGLIYIEIYDNVCTIQIFSKSNLENWLQFLHGCFGFGGLIGPFIVYLFEFKTFPIVGSILILLSITIYRINSPEKTKQKQLHESLIQKNKQKSSHQISQKCTIFLCLSFLLVSGQQSTYGSWIPSYSVLQGYSTKQHATFYSSLYWISITVFRFAFVLFSGKASHKIILLTSVAVIGSILSLFTIKCINSELGLISASILLGFCNSALFALLLSLPSEFSQTLTPSQNSYFMISVGIGEAVLSVGTGYLMKWISQEMLFCIIAIANLIALINHYNICRILSSRDVDQKNKNEYQLK